MSYGHVHIRPAAVPNYLPSDIACSLLGLSNLPDYQSGGSGPVYDEELETIVYTWVPDPNVLSWAVGVSSEVVAQIGEFFIVNLTSDSILPDQLIYFSFEGGEEAKTFHVRVYIDDVLIGSTEDNNNPVDLAAGGDTDSYVCRVFGDLAVPTTVFATYANELEEGPLVGQTINTGDPWDSVESSPVVATVVSLKEIHFTENAIVTNSCVVGEQDFSVSAGFFSSNLDEDPNERLQLLVSGMIDDNPTGYSVLIVYNSVVGTRDWEMTLNRPGFPSTTVQTDEIYPDRYSRFAVVGGQLTLNTEEVNGIPASEPIPVPGFGTELAFELYGIGSEVVNPGPHVESIYADVTPSGPTCQIYNPSPAGGWSPCGA